MTPLLAVLAAGPLLGGYRHPAAWSVAAGALWLASVPASPAIPPAAPAWILWLVWTILAAAASPEPLVSFGAVGESMTAVLALALACGASEDARRKWVRGLLFAGPLLAAAALALPDLGQGRYVGLLPPYYNYTACLEAAVVAAAAAVLAGRSPAVPALAGAMGAAGLAGRWEPWERRLAATALFFGTAEILACGSRGAALAATAGALAALWRAGRPRLAAALALAGLVAALASPGVRLRLSKDYVDLPQSNRFGANQRPAIWAASVEAAHERPLLGHGPGRFERAFVKHDVPSSVNASRYGLTATHAHSELLELAVEAGWAGLALFVAAWLGLARRALSRSDPTAAAPLAAAVAVTAHALVDNVLAMPWLRVLYASALGLSAAPMLAPRREGPAWPAACVVGALLAVWGRWPARGPAPAERLEAQARAALTRTPPDPASAERALLEAMTHRPFCAAYPQMLAELAAAKGDWTAALARTRQASGLEPNFLQSRLMEAELLERLGDRAGARRALGEVEAARERLNGLQAPVNETDRLISFLDVPRLERLKARLAR